MALQNILMQNPQLTQLLHMNYGNLPQLAQYLANQRGVDLNLLLQELQT